MAYDIDKDLALLQVAISPNDTRGMRNQKTVPIMQISPNCDTRTGDPLVDIGYPDITRRTRHHVSFDKPGDVRERWGKGALSGGTISSPVDHVNVSVETTTVDALPSSSGSPVLNSQGQVVGVMDSVETNPQAGFPYELSAGPSGSSSYYSDIIRCRDISQFLEEN